jgi:hypothetical protein
MRSFHCPLPGVLVDAASSRGDNYCMPGRTRDTRQKSAVGVSATVSLGRYEASLYRPKCCG